MPGIFDAKDTMEHTKPLGIAGEGMLASVPVSVGAGLGGHALAKHLFKQMETGKYGPRESNPGALAQRLLREGGRSPADIKKFTFDTGSHPMGPHYSWNKGEHLQLPKQLATPMVVSHEAGHASATNPASKALRLLRGNRFTPLLPLGLLVGGSLAGDRDATEMNLAQKAALPAAVVQALANHGEEMRASFVGKHLLKRLGRETPHFWKQLLGTQGTYALGNAAALAPILGGTLALKKVMERRKAARGIKKTSAEIADVVLRQVGM
jgi:hypothetical protein